MFWPSFFGVALLLLAVAAPLLAWRRAPQRRKRAERLLSLLPGAFLLGCFGVSECRQALLEGKMSQIEEGWSASRVSLLLGPPDHVLQPGTLFKGRSYGPGNVTPVWYYTPPRARGLLRLTREIPFLRFRSGLDDLFDNLVGGIFGLREGAFILQMGNDGSVMRKGSWE